MTTSSDEERRLLVEKGVGAGRAEFFYGLITVIAGEFKYLLFMWFVV